MCSLNTAQPDVSQLLFFVLIDANCSFFAFICTGARFLQACNLILCGATAPHTIGGQHAG